MSSLSRPGADEEVYNGVAVAASIASSSSSLSSSPVRVSSSSLLNSVQQQPKKQHPPPLFQNRCSRCHLVVGGGGDHHQLDRYCAFCKVKDTKTTDCNNFITCQVCNIFCYCSIECEKLHSKTHSRDCDLISRFDAKELHVKVAALIIQQSTRGQFNIHQSYKRKEDNNANDNEQHQQVSTSSTSKNSWKTRVTYLYERVVDEYLECYESIKSIGMSAEVGIQLHNDFYLVKPRIPLLLASLGYDDEAITELALMMDETGRCQRMKLRKNTDNIIHDLEEERRNFHPESWMACFLLTLLLVKLKLVSNYKLSYDGWSEYVNIMSTTNIPTAAIAAAGGGEGKGESGGGQNNDSSSLSSSSSDDTTIILLPEDVQDLIKSYLVIPVLTEISNQEQQLIQIITLLSRDDYLFDDDEKQQEESDDNDDDDSDEEDNVKEEEEEEEEGSQHSNNIILKSLLLLSPSDDDCENNVIFATTNPVIRYYLEDEDTQYNENGLFRFIHDAFQNIPYHQKIIQDLKLL